MFFAVLYLPHLIRNIQTGRIWQGWALYERVHGGYKALDGEGGTLEKDPSTPPYIKGKGKEMVALTGASSVLALAKGLVDSIQLRMVRHTNLDMGQSKCFFEGGHALQLTVL